MPEPRARILAAARQLFAARGFSGAGTRDIAALAGVNQGLIAYHFSGKEGLFREVVEQGLAALSEILEAGAGAAWLPALAGQRELLQIIVHAALEPGARRDWLNGRLPPLVRRLRALTGPCTDVSLLTFAAAAGACAGFGPALEAATGRTLDPELAARAQRSVLEAWRAGSTPSAGPWSPRRLR